MELRCFDIKIRGYTNRNDVGGEHFHGSRIDKHHWSTRRAWRWIKPQQSTKLNNLTKSLS